MRLILPTLRQYFSPYARVADPIPYRGNSSPSPFTPKKKSETWYLLIQSVFSERTRASTAANPPREVNGFADYYAPFVVISPEVDLTGVWGKCTRSLTGRSTTSMCQRRHGHQNGVNYEYRDKTAIVGAV